MAEYTIMTDNGPITILADDGMTQEQAMQHPAVMEKMGVQQQSPQPEVPPMVSNGVPYPADQESMVGYGGQITPEEQMIGAQVLGGGLGATVGTLTGGPAGTAVGSWAGTTGAEQLMKLYQGQELSAQSVAKDAAVNSLYELLPLGIGKVAKNMIPKDLAKSLMERAVKMSSNTIPTETREKVIQYALDNKLTVSKGSINDTEEFLFNVMNKINARAEDLATQGKTISTDEALGVARNYIGDNMGSFAPGQYLPGTKDKRLARYKFLEDKIEPSLREYGDDLPIETALPMRRGYDKLLAREFQRRGKQNAGAFSTVETDAMMSMAKGLREGLNSDPLIKEWNGLVSERLQWLQHIQPRVSKQATTSLIPSEVILPVAMESMTKGRLGIASALGFSRAAAANPTVLSKGALLVNGVKNAEQWIPRGYESQFLDNLFRAYINKDTKGDKNGS